MYCQLIKKAFENNILNLKCIKDDFTGTLDLETNL